MFNERTKQRLALLYNNVIVANEVVQSANIAALRHVDKFNEAYTATLMYYDLTASQVTFDPTTGDSTQNIIPTNPDVETLSVLN